LFELIFFPLNFVMIVMRLLLFMVL